MNPHRILIVDDKRFGKICSALVTQSGFQSDWANGDEEGLSRLDLARYDLVITSYPYSRQVLNLLAEKGRAVLILADYACDELLAAVAHRANCFYAVKPLDFSRFGHMVKNILEEKVPL